MVWLKLHVGKRSNFLSSCYLNQDDYADSDRSVDEAAAESGFEDSRGLFGSRQQNPYGVCCNTIAK